MSKIAIIKLSALGDIIHAMVVLEFIKKAYPNTIIDWIVEEVFAPILQNNPNIDNIITLNLKKVKRDKKLIFKEIKKIKALPSYDLVIDAQGLIKSAIVSKLIDAQRVGFDKNSIRESFASLFYDIKINKDYSSNVIERNTYLFSKALNFKISKDDILLKEPFLYFNPQEFKQLRKDKKNILFILGASTKNKIYPKEKFLNIANQLEENILLVWASESEQKSAEFISNHSKAIMMDRLSLDKLKALIAKVDLVIGGDTGPTHMAWGLNIASITIFGNTPHTRNTYITNINRVIKSDSNVDALNINKSDFSIKLIDEDIILQEINTILFQEK